jgi:hypothetical protein
MARIITDLVHYLSGDFAVFKAELWLDDVLVSPQAGKKKCVIHRT